jgi:TRAP-type mannitol/chloroaromatic compound transport system permease large subunit
MVRENLQLKQIRRTKMGDKIGLIFAIVLMIASGAGWITHLIECFSDGRWGFLIAGAIFFPIAVVHGWGIWFGFW